jgi:hypothetical protein
MRKLLIFGLVAVFASTASAQFLEDFDSYADQAAMDAVWGVGQVLDQAKGFSDGQSVTNKPEPVTGVSQALGMEYPATDAQPLVLETMVDVDVLHWWTRTWVRLEARSETGDLEDLVMLGFNSSGDSTKYHGRGGSEPLWGWYDIGADTGDPVFDRTTEWRKLTAIIKDTTLEFYVDDVLGTTVAKAPGFTYDTIGIGTSYSSQEQVWFDDIALYNIPEPATLSLLVLGGLAVIRRR